MHPEPAIESRAAVRGRRRKRGNGSVDGPVFVDTSGRRAKLLRRIGLLLGVVCIGYAVVLGMAFMGWGPSLTPSSLLPFGGGGPNGGQNSGPGGGVQPQGGTGSPPARPTGAPPSGAATGAVPTGAAPASASASVSAPSASASAAAN
ncbi:hypothetical protein [Streptomyces aurantiacus]|uniref:hypothetical protein n=1 Tax=Streptomyces aurantiacus TaxID=47760 RepID=UPI0006E3C61B|nr:hypothetical protein [Streptomyces aurantiacus]